MLLTISGALKWASSQLDAISDSASLDAEVMLLHIINKPRSYLYTWPEKELSSEQVSEFKEMLAKRLRGNPIAHIVGEREFWSLPFRVNPTTLIPRPDTEILVETALNLPLATNAKVLDLGTGTGAIALSLAHERSEWQVCAIDKVEDAVELAIENRTNLKLDQVDVFQSDWFDAVECYDFNLIVSNPPYIDEEDEHLSQGDVRFEPQSALTAPQKGFADLFHIAACARDYLAPGGYLLLEHGYQQAIELRKKLTELGYENVATVRDFGSNDRCTMGRWPR
ncbi:peptide chain release factor N(5)-glutamine methyltransferase [Shewanella youngdeokensis]|uniref:Release factor glutamine methyltransferase n=1 Tax=Shewanella youngdeokensis TaxID=2999068 RepID=A0ABZ0K051_9GAMM|nr:peptide chain release factor N(5)-glutamine methyltransferase [Shewanella sp. DAU334]